MIATIFLFLSFSFYIMFRNDWVYRNRIRLINKCETLEDFIAFRRLPSYSRMMWKFWVWDIEKFKK